jgi:hypothetical protein
MVDDSALRARLDAAAESGEILRIIYRGGSQPGSARDVCPIAISGELLRARDIAAGADKQFHLSQIELVDEHGTAPAYDPHFVHPPATADPSIGDHFAPMVAELQALGWHVALTRDAVTLHRYLKNGKPRKAAHVSLTFSEYTGIGVIDLDDDGKPVEREERWKSRSPYHVWSLDLPTRSFAHLLKAVALFLDEAHTRAPQPKGRDGGGQGS